VVTGINKLQKDKKMVKIVTLTLLFIKLPISLCFAQQIGKPYVQKVNGTELSFSMQPVPAGNFLMGSANGKPDELPVHIVKLSAFWIGTYEVTWDLYEPFVYKDFETSHNTTGKTPVHVDAVTRPTKPYLDMTFGMGKENHPALAMTHYNAIQYCKWLYARTGVFYRLPTEAEWEYACRAGTKTEYAFGDQKNLADYAWYSANSEGKTHEIGQKKPNQWGIYDMYGNVSEWTYDQFIPDFYAKSENQLDPIAFPDKLYPQVVRGGAYDDPAEVLRSANRTPSDPAWKQLDPQIPKSNWWFPEAPFVGMRLVRPVNPPSSDVIKAYYDQPVIPDF
jgi:sulfatase modifying factor 1